MSVATHTCAVCFLRVHQITNKNPPISHLSFLPHLVYFVPWYEMISHFSFSSLSNKMLRTCLFFFNRSGIFSFGVQKPSLLIIYSLYPLSITNPSSVVWWDSTSTRRHAWNFKGKNIDKTFRWEYLYMNYPCALKNVKKAPKYFHSSFLR